LAKPVVDGIEKELEGRAQVVRLNAMDGVATLVVLDGAGEVVYAKTGSPNRGEVLAAVEGVMDQ
jgi:hypothetical protein